MKKTLKNVKHDKSKKDFCKRWIKNVNVNYDDQPHA